MNFIPQPCSAVEHANELFTMVLRGERGAVNDVSKQSQLPGNPLYHWPISSAAN